MNEILKGLASLPLTIVTSILLILLGIVYFVIALLIVNVSAKIICNCDPDINWVVLSTSIIVGASMLGAAIQEESKH
ncbi:MAG: hypothetical protein DRO94_01320 [Candidatus Altiarchaeales archaeon]|nr:MAG: hypothetical protein DRO95_00575 [Candidatus Altiarchaeales archaeon]RLI95071.1 MAG: hypothetical protein DRO94_01320 [Candidatus Altiarchaeales archaeon]HDO82187.1 hypothetical protein [Candidatus Altiarchaeales archaeon]HEX54836.1 hypothetical protein [Candidatus Altiarchaeales archaeon]